MSRNDGEFHLVMTFSRSVAGEEETHRQWYDREHLKDVCQVSGFVAAHRYEAVPSGMDLGDMPPQTALAVYEVEGDLDEAVTRLRRAMKAGEIAFSPALDTGAITTWTFRRASSVEAAEGRETPTDGV
ncbi:hypothetical protein [Rhodococcus sp. NPDC057529]|uniref:hypothetical protein n=1 Tax=Rhodococcus sp. NPDC057529 TaxID=3346158 RepID=UPI0036710A06